MGSSVSGKHPPPCEHLEEGNGAKKGTWVFLLTEKPWVVVFALPQRKQNKIFFLRPPYSAPVFFEGLYLLMESVSTACPVVSGSLFMVITVTCHGICKQLGTGQKGSHSWMLISNYLKSHKPHNSLSRAILEITSTYAI